LYRQDIGKVLPRVKTSFCRPWDAHFSVFLSKARYFDRSRAIAHPAEQMPPGSQRHTDSRSNADLHFAATSVAFLLIARIFRVRIFYELVTL